jgi:hypothetical protein
LSALNVVAQTAALPKSAFFKTSDGISIHYLEAGSGKPVVFIPGWTMPAWIWQKQIDEFSKKYHVIARVHRARATNLPMAICLKRGRAIIKSWSINLA